MADQDAVERWLRSAGVPAFIRGHARPAAVLRRPWSLLSGVLVVGLIAVGLTLTGLVQLPHGVRAITFAVLLALAVGYLLTALGVTSVIGFTLGWFLRTVWRAGSGMTHVLPLLLVALVFTFLGAETWQSIGRLKGLPLVLTSLLIGGVAVALLVRRRRSDDEDEEFFADAEAVQRALPEPLRPATAPAYDAAPLTLSERINLRMISVLGRVLVAAVVGLAIAAFFVIFGVLTVDLPVATSWVGAEPTIWLQGTLGNHTYTLTAEHIRVAVFLGVFSALYFIVSAASDRALRSTLSADADRHVRECLAVRAMYRALPPPGSVRQDPGHRRPRRKEPVPSRPNRSDQAGPA